MPFTRLIVWFVAACLAAAAAGCGSASTSLVSPTAQKCQVSVNGATSAFGPAGGSGSLTVDTARECSWTAAAQSSWIVFGESHGGQGPATVSFSVQPNQAPQARSGAIDVNGQRVTVSQEAAPCLFSLDTTRLEVGPGQSDLQVRVTAMSGCGWSASAVSSWLRVTAGGSGNGTASVRISVAANPGEARTGTVLVAGQTVTVNQGAAPPPETPPAPAPPTPPAPPAPPPPGPPTPPAPSPCSYSVTPTTLSSQSAGGELSLNITTASTCAWQASTSATWFVLQPSSGTGSGTVQVTVQPNGGVQRSATAVVAGTTVTVVQAATAPETIRVSGQISRLSGSCPNLSFRVGDADVQTNAATEFQAGSCSKFETGTSVNVEGTRAAGESVIVATKVRRLN